MAKQKLSPKASAAKKARDIAMAKTPARKAKKAENQRIGQRSDSDLHHSGSGAPTRVSIKNNRGNFGKGTKKESPIFSKRSPVKQDGFKEIDAYNEVYSRVAPKIREDLGRKAEGALTTIEKKDEGMQLVFDAIKSGADKEEITKIVREHNRDLYGSVRSGEVVKHKGFANAKIGLKEAFSYIPEKEKEKPVEKESTDEESQYYYRGAMKPGTIEEAERRFGSAIAPLSDPARQAARDLFYQQSAIDSNPQEIIKDNVSYKPVLNPLLKKGFKMPGFGKRK